jgi:hypothetical protein
LNDDILAAFSTDEFLAQRPFPWWSFEEVLRPEAFERLCADFPPLSLFEWHQGKERAYGQQPHNRYYLAYKSEQYPAYDGRQKREFPEVWQAFLTELETSPAYSRFIERNLGRSDLKVRYTFHVGVTGSVVSPHVDKGRKVGTHIFYFNTPDDWDPAWGGATLVLSDKQNDDSAPAFSDFATATRVENLGNSSFFFRNTADAWHGVPTMACPEGAQRRIFNVVFERPEQPGAARRSPLRQLRRRAKGVLTRR